ncbi:MAG: type I-MYXAN CRISPR-associated protein Cas6/Cmx6 [Thiomargarita sp.]|nr:type I-MYXAN CRISPR-associated protein Cas6/Cmx6 [Thiomargarita sp.]
MLWQENKSPIKNLVSQKLVDFSYDMKCQSLAVDHAYELSQAIKNVLPWFEAEPLAGLHLIHGAGSGSGWYRPEKQDDILYLSRRTKLVLRLPPSRLVDAQVLSGKTLKVANNTIEVGEATEKSIRYSPVLFSRYILADDSKFQDEDTFLDISIAQIQQMGVKCRKALCGKSHYFKFPNKMLFTRSLMIADLDRDDSIILQEQGLGQHKKIGFGLFIPHKNVKEVNQYTED